MMELQMYHQYDEYGWYDRDYLQGKLAHALIAGHSYYVSFYTVADGIEYTVNNIGAFLDDGTIDTTAHPQWVQSTHHPQIVDTNIISDSTDWNIISGTFVATGNEQFKTIGQFSRNEDSRVHILRDTTTYSCTPCDFFSWYLVDDVSVIDCSNTPFAGNDTLILPGDSTFLGTNEIILPYKWYVAGGATPIDSGGGLWVHPTTTTRYVVTQDICGEGIKTDTVTVHVWPDTPISVAYIPDPENVLLSPNPAKTTLTIENAKGCNVEIFDALGRLALHKDALNKREQLDIASLESGVYLVVVENPVSGYRVVRRLEKRE
jgi:hypothetical protein